jgi:alkanesulfonate monooxygenase SsuD/methylene tetrahydromethanopterin reductase-like flavin-dependent oxidoreductase (luciferase family)
VKFGVGIFPTEDLPPPPELARMAEERGFESLWLTEHTHIPARGETPTRQAVSSRPNTAAPTIRSSR